MKYGLIIPTLNAERWLGDLIPALATQTVPPTRIIVIDSSSTDQTAAIFQGAGAEVITIARSEFDHGATRQRGVELLADIPIIMFLTQDAIPAKTDTFARLIDSFSTPEVGVAFGRQLPRRGAGGIEAHARLFNYPAHDVEDRRENIATRGVRASFCSNSFSAYRTQTLADVGGFPKRCIFGEDAVVAMRLIRRGWVKRYVSDATVYHSHSYSPPQEFRRSFDIGVLHDTTAELREVTRGARGEGLKFILSELRYLYRNDPTSIPSGLIRSFMKAAGYYLGKNHMKLPARWAAALSMNKGFWQACQ